MSTLVVELVVWLVMYIFVGWERSVIIYLMLKMFLSSLTLSTQKNNFKTLTAHIHTHTHTHARTHTHTHAHTHACTQTRTHTHAHTFNRKKAYTILTTSQSPMVLTEITVSSMWSFSIWSDGSQGNPTTRKEIRIILSS